MSKYKAVAILIAVAEEDVDQVINDLHESAFNHPKVQYTFTHETAELDNEQQEELNSVLNQEGGE